MFASEHQPHTRPTASVNPHRAAPRAARACHDSSALCADSSPTQRALLRRRRPGVAERAPQRCVVAEAARA
jgi:hypothetical protein